jgi:hypothetical protein
LTRSSFIARPLQVRELVQRDTTVELFRDEFQLHTEESKRQKKRLHPILARDRDGARLPADKHFAPA